MEITRGEQEFRVPVTVIVVSYKPVLEKLLITIKSILLQKDIEIQIIVCDDGSKDTYFNEIENLFDLYGFTNYILVHNENNQGTVQNFCSAFPYIKGEYIKGISPGDYFYNCYVLNKWLAFMEHNKCKVSFGDAVYYEHNNFTHFIRRNACPCLVEPYIHRNIEEIKRNYLLFNDLILGASTFIRTDLFLKYMNFIKGKIIYAEDHIFRIMTADNEEIFYFPKKVIFYEFGGGISTTKYFCKKNPLDIDWDTANKIIQNRLTGESLLNFINLIEYREKRKKDKLSFIYRLRFNLSVKGKVIYNIKRKFEGRQTSVKIDENSLFYIFNNN